MYVYMRIWWTFKSTEELEKKMQDEFVPLYWGLESINHAHIQLASWMVFWKWAKAVRAYVDDPSRIKSNSSQAKELIDECTEYAKQYMNSTSKEARLSPNPSIIQLSEKAIIISNQTALFKKAAFDYIKKVEKDRIAYIKKVEKDRIAPARRRRYVKNTGIHDNFDILQDMRDLLQHEV